MMHPASQTPPPQPASLTRRRFLLGAGAVTVLVAGGGVWRASSEGVFSPGTGPAYEPWTTWRTDRPEGPLGIVHAGILAANPHNTQPWLFRIRDNTVELFADTTRNLGAFDPFLREMHIGLGCAVENMMLAAQALGYAPALTLATGELTEPPSDVEPTPAATLQLEPGPTNSSSLFAAIPDRHTNRGAYDTTRPLSPAVLHVVQDMPTDDGVRLFLFADDPRKSAFGRATVEATAEIVGDAEMVHASHAWFCNSWQELQTRRAGVTLDAVGMPPLITALAKMAPALPAGRAHQAWLRSTETVHCATAAAFGCIAVRSLYDREQTLRAGRLWQRLHLWATAAEVAMHPMNQAVEMVDRQRQLGSEPTWAARLAKFVGAREGRPTFVFRMGYPARSVAASPRRALDDVLI